MSALKSRVSVATVAGAAAIACVSSFFVACGGSPVAPTAPATPAPSASTTPPAEADALGPKPEPATGAPYKAPAPVVYTAANGVTVWLLERHTLPVVSIVVGVPSGAASDPAARPGLAYASATMLDEGAGSRGALEFARAVDILGASLESSATLDASFVTLTVLKRNLTPAFALLGDTVVRPRFDAKEWKRVQDLWVNDLKARATEPDAVMQVVARAALFGKESPYGHPITGLVGAAQKTSLEDAKGFYKTAWRPDRATVIAAGDVTKADLAPLLESAFGAWRAPATPALTPPAPAEPKGPAPRFVVVDRADAPQSVIALVRGGVAAGDPVAAPLSRVNNALGGSFTSRLNQDLREEHGWSYGARSRVAFSRGVGSTSASAAVFTDKTGDALKALMADVQTYAKTGLTDDEVEKTRSHARAELVEVYEQIDSAAFRLATNATCGLSPDFETQAGLRRDAASKDDLNKLAAKYFDSTAATILVVGPKDKILPQLAGLGLPEPEMRDEEGNVRAAAPAKPAAAKAAAPAKK